MCSSDLVNPVNGLATVDYDPAKTNLDNLQAAIKECGFHCAGEALPKHICQEHSMSRRTGHEPAGDVAPHKDHGGGKTDAMAQEMGHGAGVDMQAMVRDMRNRFFIALGFTVPIFFLSPMGMDFIKIQPPFGLRLDLVLFVLASGAILYPVWPFIVAAYRALRVGVANMAVLVVLSVGTGYLFSVEIGRAHV